ncbi:DNA-directed RNA polymerase core subunit rpc40 [Malassezia psittaci]|uniref:DNA-directed RNA polymerases I and III subunit RPAC1 n=1 Tax=Malassezia psittaci TaxID=1821823 RepID=A0AAF0JFH5_9BASI|nr:DNA-directed RNA polymerase core subunit rpc40 [Malassezia psittaci]
MDRRNIVEIHPEHVGNVSSTSYPLHVPGESGAWDTQLFEKNLKVDLTRLTTDQCEFDLVGVDASIANAVRRSLIAEVPTVAIEHVYVWNNTSIIQDEVLSHRLGLIPLAIDPSKLSFKMDEEANDQNTVVFNLKAECHKSSSAKDAPVEGRYVYSSQLEWDPKGDQSESMADKPPAPANPDILIAKMAPGQKMEMELHCEKGIGKDHAKFSPVATASYRLLPHIEILQMIPEPLIPKLISCFPEGVLERGGENGVRVLDPRKDTVSREVLRHPEFNGMIRLGRVQDHFLFSVESTGVYEPEALLPASIEVLQKKCALMKLALDTLSSESS